ncbi:MAG: hypothetical protein V1926_02685 [Candidatus Peregrinibacteria bacterium]
MADEELTLEEIKEREAQLPGQLENLLELIATAQDECCDDPKKLARLEKMRRQHAELESQTSGQPEYVWRRVGVLRRSVRRLMGQREVRMKRQ